MAPVSREEQALFDRIEPVLAYAVQQEDAAAVSACRSFVDLYTQPRHVSYNPAEWLERHAALLASERHHLFFEATSRCIGMPERVLVCLRALIEAFELEEDSGLAIEIFEQPDRGEAIPCIGLGLEGPGHIPAEIQVAGYFRLTLEELGEQWTLATRGGRIDRTSNGLLLRLKGLRRPPAPLDAAQEVLDRLDSSSTREGITAVLSCIDGSPRYEPADAKALLNEVLEAYRPLLSRGSISLDAMLEPELPPVVIHRTRLRMFFVQLFEFARWMLRPAGEMVLLAEYERESRQIKFTAELSRHRHPVERTFHLASMERALHDHGGAVQFEFASGGERRARITADLPDPVGKRLDAWIPGWDVFSARSRQMLRLLKSGGPSPPEDFILGGVLEEELERWLMPRFEAPVARNIAHELEVDAARLARSSSERLKKVLGQIARGKVRKEICNAPYAGEILWAFRGDERRRAALGVGDIGATDQETFCSALLAQPPEAAEALRFLACVLRFGGIPVTQTKVQ